MSITEQWANEKASDFVVEPSDIELKFHKPKRVAKTFSEIVCKHNKYHDPETGKFTFAPDGPKSAPPKKKVSWSDKVNEEQDRVLGLTPQEQAEYLAKTGYESDMVCRSMAEKGTIQTALQNYFEIMKQNGDPTPTKPTSGQLLSEIKLAINRDEYWGIDDAREQYIPKQTGMNEKATERTLKEMRTWFTGDWEEAKTSVLDTYIKKDHVYDGTIWRGMKMSPYDYDQFMDGLDRGSVISMRRNSSWTSNPNVAWKFAGQDSRIVHSIIIECNQNKTSAPVNYLSGLPDEDEVLASSKAKWTVLRVEQEEEDTGARHARIYVVEKGD